MSFCMRPSASHVITGENGRLRSQPGCGGDVDVWLFLAITSSTGKSAIGHRFDSSQISPWQRLPALVVASGMLGRNVRPEAHAATGSAARKARSDSTTIAFRLSLIRIRSGIMKLMSISAMLFCTVVAIPR
jgi:hypothetical protein